MGGGLQKGRAVTNASYQCAKPQFIHKWKFAFYFKLQTELRIQESVPLKSHSGRRQGREKESYRGRVRGTYMQGWRQAASSRPDIHSLQNRTLLVKPESPIDRAGLPLADQGASPWPQDGGPR